MFICLTWADFSSMISWFSEDNPTHLGLTLLQNRSNVRAFLLYSLTSCPILQLAIVKYDRVDYILWWYHSMSFWCCYIPSHLACPGNIIFEMFLLLLWVGWGTCPRIQRSKCLSLYLQEFLPGGPQSSSLDDIPIAQCLFVLFLTFSTKWGSETVFYVNCI